MVLPTLASHCRGDAAHGRSQHVALVTRPLCEKLQDVDVQRCMNQSASCLIATVTKLKNLIPCYAPASRQLGCGMLMRLLAHIYFY